ncbi:MAG: putative Elongation factor 1-alpha, partial [Streblomastix strix]
MSVGITIEIALRKLETNKYYFTIIDAPGHRDFIKNMITGTSQADTAQFVVTANQGEFEACISKDRQTGKHAFLTYMMGVRQMIALVNKMDDKSVNFSEARYNEIIGEMRNYLKKIGYNSDKIKMIPISGFCEILKRPFDKPLHLPIQDGFKIGGIGTVPVGRVIIVILTPGHVIIITNTIITTKCESSKMHHDAFTQAVPGDNAGLHLKDMNRIHFIEGDTDSAYWAISGNPNEDFTQQFNAVIKDRDFYNENTKYFFPTIKGDVYDEKKILGLAIERQGTVMYALAPKNYMIETNYCANSKIKLKGVNQKTNKITKDQIVDCINEGKITKCTNNRLGQKNHQMSQLSIEKNGITGIHNKMVV